jgi:hypothetical protein
MVAADVAGLCCDHNGKISDGIPICNRFTPSPSSLFLDGEREEDSSLQIRGTRGRVLRTVKRDTA